MFFWGSYNFQVPQLVEHASRPPLRYPLYVPPTPSAIESSGNTNKNYNQNRDPHYIEEGKETKEKARLHQINEHRVLVGPLGCGQKHLVCVMTVVEHKNTLHNATIDGMSHRSNEKEKEEKGRVEERGAITSSVHFSGEKWAVYGMGSNHSGQLGHRVPEYITTLTKLHVEDFLADGTTVSTVACGNKHTILSTTNGNVFAAGDNNFSQLGITTRVIGFAPVNGLANIKAVFAAGNVSFALDKKGHLYSWGEAQYGHLCHGDNGERLDKNTLQSIKTNITTPTLIQWFVRHHVMLVEVSVGRAHIVCRSNDDVYTCGEGIYGKLGSGGISPLYTPTRVKFPTRTHPERLCGVAAGDDHTLVLRESPVVGAVVYFFGKTGNGDGQLTPIIVQAPASITRIGAGRGTLCTAVTSDGRLYVWGKHSYTKVSNGTPAAASRSVPQQVVALEPFIITDAVVGGVFVVAVAATLRHMLTETQKQEDEKKDIQNQELSSVYPNSSRNNEQSWDVVVPLDDRVGLRDTEAPGTQYENAVQTFLMQYLEHTQAALYIKQLPTAPPLTDHNANAFVRIGAHSLTVGQKVRLWMTDVYALGIVAEVLSVNNAAITPPSISGTYIQHDATITNDKQHHSHSMDGQQLDKQREPINQHTKEQQHGYRFRITWQREDWKDEEVTLYSEDETLSIDNKNRWQPLWFLQNQQNPEEYKI